MPELAPKKVSLAQVVEDLKSGLTRWKKDDIGFGSLEKKYNLQHNEMIELISHPKIKGVESRIPTFVIVDDLPDEEAAPEQQEEKTSIEVAQPVMQETKQVVQQTKVVVEKPREKIEAFI